MANIKIPVTITKEMVKEAVKELRETEWKEDHSFGMLEPVENPDEVVLYDEMASIIILVRDEQHPFEEKVFPKNLLKWHTDEYAEKEYGEQFMSITLGSISRQLTAIGVTGSIIVLYETGLDGTVYRYGNHGDYWERIGKLAGWA